MKEYFLILSTALALDVAFGDPGGRWHPVALFGSFAAHCERCARKWLGGGILAGLTLWLILVVFFSVLFGVFVAFLGKNWYFSGIFGSAITLYFCISLRSLCSHAAAVRRELQRGELARARQKLSLFVSRKTDSLDEPGIARGAIESLGENLCDAVTAPLFFATCGWLLGGAAGAAVGAVMYRIINTLDAMWGYRNNDYERFGKVAARMDDIANFIPARLTLPAIALGAFLTGGAAVGALICGWRFRRAHPSPNSCWGMAAYAGALRVQLGGATEYESGVENYPHIGLGGNKLDGFTIRAAERLTWVSSLLFILFLAGGATCLKLYI